MRSCKRDVKVYKERLAMVADTSPPHGPSKGRSRDLKVSGCIQGEQIYDTITERKGLGVRPEAGEHPDILQGYANTHLCRIHYCCFQNILTIWSMVIPL